MGTPHRVTKRCLPAAAGLLLLSAAAPAAAQDQPWLEDRMLGEGIGIRAGNFELHPGVAAEAGYDSNYFQRSGANESEKKIAALRLRLTPSISLSTLGDRRRNAVAAGAAPELTLRSSVWLSYNEIVSLDSDHTEEVAGHRDLDLGVALKADIAPAARLGGDVYGDYVRSTQPSNVTGVGITFDRGSVRAGAGMTYRPGGGLFEWRLGYELRVNYFEAPTYQLYDNYWHRIPTAGRWRFLPRTAILYDAEYTAVRYTNRQSPQNDGEFVQVRGGLSGLVTNRFAFLALVGWLSSYFVDRGIHLAQNYDGFVGQAELKWFLLPPPSAGSASVGLSSIALGYTHDFSPSYLGSFYIRDRGYAKANYFVGGVILLSAEAGISREQYPTYQFLDLVGPAISQNSSFGATVFDLKLFGEYRFSDRLAANTTIMYDTRSVNGELGTTSPDPDAEPREDVNYSRLQLWLAARLFW